MVQPHVRHLIGGHVSSGGDATATRRERATPLSTFVLAEVHPSGPASVGFGYSPDRWSPALTSRSLSVEVSSFGIGGERLA
jgi:hypothetical protein